MNLDIFIDDFELTENTEELHAILGRCLILATRFDNLCDHVTKFMKIKEARLALLSEEGFTKFVNSIFIKFPNLNRNINSLPVEQEVKNVLHVAREARNEVAHSLSIGMTGCLDMNVDENDFKSQVSSLIMDIAAGDYLISAILSVLNKESVPNYTENDYKRKIIEWILGE